ncbi:MAG: hypothetical protein QM656_01800 [Paracoccaceae bacterium]
MALLDSLLGAGDHVWSIGTSAGVIGVTPAGSSMVDGPTMWTGQVGLRLQGIPRLLAFETLSSDPAGWNHGIALCVAAPSPARRAGVITSLGPDSGAIRPQDRNLPLFDLGLGHQGVSHLLLRPAPERVESLRSLCGLAWQDAIPRLDGRAGCWIVETPLARLEHRAVEGPPPFHTFPAQTGLTTHPRTTPMPDGLVPVAHVFPPHPLRQRPGVPQAFDPERHRTFQAILERHGRADLWALKQSVLAALREGRDIPAARDRHSAAVIRVTLRQALHIGVRPAPEILRERDRALFRAMERRE